jgi:hypothetical protein
VVERNPHGCVGQVRQGCRKWAPRTCFGARLENAPHHCHASDTPARHSPPASWASRCSLASPCLARRSGYGCGRSAALCSQFACTPNAST